MADAAILRIIAQRDKLLEQITALQAKADGLDMAIEILARGEPAAKPESKP